MVEERINLVRLAVLLIGTVAYLGLMDRSRTIPWLAYTLLALGWIYAPLAYRFPVVERTRSTAALTLVTDASFLGLWITATGGYFSEFYVIIYASVISTAFQYGRRQATVAAAAYAAGYICLMAVLGHLETHLAEILVRAAYVFVIAPLGGVLAHEALEQGSGRLHMLTLTRENAAARAEAEESLSLLNATLDSTADGILVVDRAGRITQLNRRFIEMWRLPAAIVDARDDSKAIEFVLDQLIHPDGFRRKVEELYAHPEAESFDVLEFKDGRVVERYSRPQYLENRIAGRVWSFRDATDRLEAEAALRESELKFRKIFHASADAVTVSRVSDQRIIEVNDGFVRMSGFSREEALGRTAVDLGLWVDPEARAERFARLREGRTIHNLKAEFRHRDGSRFCGLISSTIMRIGGEECVFSFVRDVTDQEKAREALARSEEKYRELFEESKDAIFICGLGGDLLDVNRAALALFGYDSKEEFLRLGPEAFLGDSAEQQRTHDLILEQGFLQDYEMVVRRKDGTPLNVLVTANAAYDDDGNIVGLRGMTRDVTRQKRLEAQLQQAQKLDAVGRLAAGVAHEVNNPLTYILSHLEALAAELPELAQGARRPKLLEAAQRRIHEATEGTYRVRRIVRDLRSFARADEGTRTPVDIHAVLEKAINLSFNQIRHRARLERDFGKIPPVGAIEFRLEQVFVNLLINASQAIDEGHVDRNRITLRTRREGNEVRIDVSDTGTGIPADQLDKIFDPFFTTKDVGEGSGLGLSICHNIVTSFGGRIEVESRAGEGCRFSVILPVSHGLPAESIPPITPKAEAVEPTGRRRILVVDDEPLVRASIGMTLRLAYDVVECQSGREALDRLAEDSRFDIVLCDLMMPDTSGAEVYEAALARDRTLARRIVFMTGGAFTRSAQDFLRRIPNRCIEKPFSAPELLEIMNDEIEVKEAS